LKCDFADWKDMSVIDPVCCS